MTTSWDRIDGAFKTWLQSTGATAANFNGMSGVERAATRASYDSIPQQQQKVNRKRSRFEESRSLDTVVRSLPSASTFAHGEWKEKIDHRFCFHRPSPDPKVVPVELRLPVFAQFVENCKKPSLKIKDSTMIAIETFFTEMCAGYPNEDLRSEKARERLGEILGVSISKASVDAGTTDGSYLSGEQHLGFLLNMEAKNEIGNGGGDPFLENWAYHARFWASHRAYPRPHATFLIVLAGPNFGVAGGISTPNSVVSEWLTPMLPMNVSPNSEIASAIVRVLASLRLGVESLRLSVLAPTVPELPQIEGLDGLILEGALVAECVLLYKGTFNQSPVVVKFVRSYCVGAHKEMAHKGMAPEIIKDIKVADWDVIVMELVTGTAPELCEQKGKLLEVLNALHESGYVHGDARLSNFVWKGDGQPLLIDFDTAGRIGQTFFPPFRNREITWGALTGAEIEPHHDIDMLSRAFTLSETAMSED